MENFLENTTELLKSQIGKMKESARTAWKVGQTLSDIRDNNRYSPDFESFNKYIENAVGMTIETANQYIKLYLAISNEDDISKLMLVTHLYLIIELDQEQRTILLNVMRDMEKEGTITSYAKLGSTIKAIHSLITNFQHEVNSNKEMRKLWHDLDEIKKASQANNPKHQQSNKDYLGTRLKSPHFEQFESLYANIPIDEHSLLGLFCVIFHEMKKHTFTYEDKPCRFTYINFIRQPFPDAEIQYYEIPNNPKQKQLRLRIEFEYSSFTFVHHDHDPKKCDLIICWEDNWSVEKGKVILPILSIKQFLEEGKITLRY